MVSNEVRCNKGHELHLSTVRSDGEDYFICDFCDRNDNVRKGFYACHNADDCDFYSCTNCYKAKMPKPQKLIEESKEAKQEKVGI